MSVGDKVTVTGPDGSAQAGKTGVVVAVEQGVVVVKLDGETRPRNFSPNHLKEQSHG